jgi:2-keto-4-pentenoate hydratase/2-oxohepta-3-ene-1,7-dioic acid hydratase in catechol pathway
LRLFWGASCGVDSSEGSWRFAARNLWGHHIKDQKSTRYGQSGKTSLSKGDETRTVFSERQENCLHWTQLCVIFSAFFAYGSRDHIAELGNQRPTKPFFFLKPTSSIVRPKYVEEQPIGKHSPVLIPHGMNVHYEVELAVIIGQTIKDNAFRSKSRAEIAEQATNPDFREFWEHAIWGYAIGIQIWFQLMPRN